MIHRAGAWIRDEALLAALLLSSFIARWLLADRNSYWLDELYSVAVYGQWQDSTGTAVGQLAESSVHPPLYQVVLNQWMTAFGDSEVATRTLSNLYATAATLFLYLFMRDVFSRRVALTSALIFVLLYTPLFYALESRSYAQTVFLVTVSSFLIQRIVRRGVAAGWRRALLAPSTAVFTLVNLALLLTHYYNVFFWVAQALIVALLLAIERPRRWLAAVGAFAGLYAVQAVGFAVVWGSVLVDDFRRRADAYPIYDDVAMPGDLLFDLVIRPNISLAWPVRVVGLALVALLVVQAIRGLWGSPESDQARRGPWATVYLTGWLVIPLVVVTIVFAIADFERYSLRYFLYCVVPLAPLIVLTIDNGLRLAGEAWARWRRSAFPQTLAFVITVGVVIGAAILPNTYAAATATKADWRGNVQRVVDVVDRDPERSFLVVEASHRDTSLADYYFERFSDDLRVSAVLDINDDRGAGHAWLAGDGIDTGGYDRLIVLFPHLTAADYPAALAELESRYPVRHRQLDQAGRGFIVFDLNP